MTNPSSPIKSSISILKRCLSYLTEAWSRCCTKFLSCFKSSNQNKDDKKNVNLIRNESCEKKKSTLVKQSKLEVSEEILTKNTKSNLKEVVVNESTNRGKNSGVKGLKAGSNQKKRGPNPNNSNMYCGENCGGLRSKLSKGVRFLTESKSRLVKKETSSPLEKLSSRLSFRSRTSPKSGMGKSLQNLSDSLQDGGKRSTPTNDQAKVKEKLRQMSISTDSLANKKKSSSQRPAVDISKLHVRESYLDEIESEYQSFSTKRKI